MTTNNEVRRAVADDAPHFRAIAWLIEQQDTIVLVSIRDGTHRVGGAIDFAGGPTEPGVPFLRIAETDDADRAIDLAPLLDCLVDVARARGLERLVIGWDPMDAAGLRLLETAGFRPTGTGPYRDLGGGVVDWVTGYADATGSTIDLQVWLLNADH